MTKLARIRPLPASGGQPERPGLGHLVRVPAEPSRRREGDPMVPIGLEQPRRPAVSSRPPADKSSSAGQPPRLLDRVRIALRTRHYSMRTEKAYVGWIRRFILFHGKRHPQDLAEPQIAAFLSSLADPGRASASSQNQALAALLFLYGQVLGRELAWMGDIVHAKRPQRLPVVLTREESRSLLANLAGPYWIVGGLLYGGGLRLLEALQLRIKDVELDRREILVRDGKGRKDRHTVLPEALVSPLGDHLAAIRLQHERDLAAGALRAQWSFRMPCGESTRLLFVNGPGSGCSRQPGPTSMPKPARPVATIYTRPPSSAPSPPPPIPRESPSPRPRTPCDILSRRTCSKMATTSGPFRSSSATKT